MTTKDSSKQNDSASNEALPATTSFGGPYLVLPDSLMDAYEGSDIEAHYEEVCKASYTDPSCCIAELMGTDALVLSTPDNLYWLPEKTGGVLVRVSSMDIDEGEEWDSALSTRLAKLPSEGWKVLETSLKVSEAWFAFDSAFPGKEAREKGIKLDIPLGDYEVHALTMRLDNDSGEFLLVRLSHNNTNLEEETSERPMHSSPAIFQQLQALYGEGAQAIQESNFNAGVQKFSEGLEIDDHYREQYVTMYAQRAYCYQMQEMYEQAIPDLLKAIEMEPDFHHADYYLKLGRCYELGLEDKDKAIECYSQSIAAAPDFVGSYYYRGLIQYDAGNFAEALPDIEKTIQLDSNPNEALLNIRDYLCKTLGVEPAEDDDPEVFPGEPIARLSQYVAVTKAMQTGNMQALSDYGVDMMQFGTIAQKWAAKMTEEPRLALKFGELMGA